MSAVLVATMAETAGIDISEAEKRWSKAKEITTEEKGLKESDGEDFWKYVTGVFKMSMGIGDVMESAGQEKARVLAHGGATVHIPHVPPTENGSGKSEGLSGSQTEEAGSSDPTVSKDGKPVKPVLESATDGGCTCQGCGKKYKVDWIIPDVMWNEIRPEGKPEGGGMLCPSCIGQRLESLGRFGALHTIMEAATAEEVHAAAHEAATSHLNDLPEPSEAQKLSGNYKKGRIRLHGMEIVIENPKGSKRSGVDPDGTPWECTIPAHYGDIKRTEGADGDPVDIYVGDHPESELVFVVDQVDADTGKFDEHKVIAGCLSQKEARALYVAGFSDGKGAKRLGSMTPMHVSAFKAWLDGDTTKPLSDAIMEAAFTESELREWAKRSPLLWKARILDATTFDDIQAAFSLKWPTLVDSIDMQDALKPGTAPPVLYHGTSFESRKSYSDHPETITFDHAPMFFTSNKAQAALYASGEGAEVIRVHIDVRTPMVVDDYDYMAGADGSLYDDVTYWLEQGYDGAVYRDPKDGTEVWATFKPGQAKPILAQDLAFNRLTNNSDGDKVVASTDREGAMGSVSKDGFFKVEQPTAFYIEKLSDLGAPEDIIKLAKDLTAKKKPVDVNSASEDGVQQEVLKWDGAELHYLSKWDGGFNRLQIIPSNGYVDFGQGFFNLDTLPEKKQSGVPTGEDAP